MTLWQILQARWALDWYLLTHYWLTMLARTWRITDTHFNHVMLEERGYRPVGFTELIKKQWRRYVQPQDLVYHLGDVILGENGTLGDILASLPGTKILVRGNHDHASNGWYRRNGFSFVAHGVLTGGVWLTHAPQATLPDGAVLNVHGHLHNSTHHGTEFAAHCKLLALENIGYAPVEFNEFVGFTPTRKLLLGISEEV